MLAKYYPGRYDHMEVEEFIKFHEKNKIEDVYYFNVGCYSTKYTPELVDQWLDDLGLSSQSQILMPESELTDLEELKDNLSAEEYDKIVKDMSGKFIPVKKDLQCGYMTLEQLYHRWNVIILVNCWKKIYFNQQSCKMIQRLYTKI